MRQSCKQRIAVVKPREGGRYVKDVVAKRSILALSLRYGHAYQVDSLSEHKVAYGVHGLDIGVTNDGGFFGSGKPTQ